MTNYSFQFELSMVLKWLPIEGKSTLMDLVKDLVWRGNRLPSWWWIFS